MRQIKQTAKDEIKGLKIVKIVSNSITNFLIPFLIAVIVGYKNELEQGSKFLYWGLLISSVIIQLIFGIINLLFNNNLAIEAFFYAQDLSEENEVIKRENLILKSDIKSLNLLQTSIQAFRELESQFIRKNEADLINFIDLTVSIIVDIRDQLFNFGANELWNFAVYLYNPDSDKLEVVWRKKHHNHPSQGEERKWKSGQGHIGKAFSDGTAKITGDALESNTASLMSPPPRLQRSYDQEAYRSFASIPIMLENETEVPFGVLVATSNKVNRFNKFNCLILKHLADTLANVIVLRDM
jgi:hypothetical protein